MKILLAADVHVEHSAKSNNERGLRRGLLALDAIHSAVRKHRPNALVIAGDLFDKHGIIESSLAVDVKKTFIEIAKSGCAVLIAEGNHGYAENKPLYYGRGMCEAILGGLESIGIYVADAAARYIKLPLPEGSPLIADAEDGGSCSFMHFVLVPYRHSNDEFTELAEDAFGRELPNSGPNEADKIAQMAGRSLVAWHVGLPFGSDIWAGDEPDNGFAVPSNPFVQAFFSLALRESGSGEKTIYLGHYHKPADVPFEIDETQANRNRKKIVGVATYIGSTATRTRDETGQKKRLLLLEAEGLSSSGEYLFKRTEIDTGLYLDVSVESVEAGKRHLDQLAANFGHDVLELVNVHYELPEEASIGDWQEACRAAGSYMRHFSIRRPQTKKTIPFQDLFDRRRSEPNLYSQSDLDRDLAMRALISEVSRKWQGVTKKAQSTDIPAAMQTTLMAVKPDWIGAGISALESADCGLSFESLLSVAADAILTQANTERESENNLPSSASIPEAERLLSGSDSNAMIRRLRSKIPEREDIESLLSLIARGIDSERKQPKKTSEKQEQTGSVQSSEAAAANDGQSDSRRLTEALGRIRRVSFALQQMESIATAV